MPRSPTEKSLSRLPWRWGQSWQGERLTGVCTRGEAVFPRGQGAAPSQRPLYTGDSISGCTVLATASGKPTLEPQSERKLST